MTDGGPGRDDPAVSVRLYRPNSCLSEPDQTDVNVAIQLAQSFVGHQKQPGSFKTLQATRLDIVRATRKRDYRWCSSAFPVPTTAINAWLLRHPSTHLIHEDSDEEAVEDIDKVPNFHESDDAIISAPIAPEDPLSSSPTGLKEGSLFSPASGLKRKKPQHMYGRKSSSRLHAGESPSRNRVSYLLSFRELCEESASDRDVDESSPVPTKRTKTVQILPRKDVPGARAAVVSKIGRRPLQLAAAASRPLHRQEAMPNLHPELKQKKQYQFRRPFPLAIQSRPRQARDPCSEGASRSRDSLGIANEATEVIEEYSDAGGCSRRTSIGPAESMILDTPIASFAVQQMDMQTSRQMEPDAGDFEFGPQQLATSDPSIHLTRSRTSLSISAVSLQLPTAAQRAASTSRTSGTSWLAPNITVTMPTSPPRASGSPDMTSSPMALGPGSTIEQQNTTIDSNRSLPINAFLDLAIPRKYARPPPPPALPFRQLSRHIEPATIQTVLIRDSSPAAMSTLLAEGRRGWWELPLSTSKSSLEGISRRSKGIILGLDDSAPVVSPGTVIWTLPRLRLLVRQIAAMAATRKWGLLDVFQAPSSDAGSAVIRIVCPAHLALRLRTVLSEMACKLDAEGEETEELASAEMEKAQIGTMWLSVQAGVRLVWWDETERIPVMLA